MAGELSPGRVLITGATGGIGRAIARAFAAEGAELILSGRRHDVLEGLATELRATAIAADLAERDDVHRLIADAGRVDVLIVNAALPASGLLLDLTPAQIATMLEVNLTAQITIARALAEGMAQRRRGHMVFITSLGGLAASPAASIYNATKFGLRGFALGAREDLRRFGVGVSVVAPGLIRDAGMFADSGARLPPGVGTRAPEDVAQAVLKAVRHNRAELIVAPLHLALGARIASVLPGLGARGQRLLGGDAVADQVAAGQLDKRPPQ